MINYSVLSDVSINTFVSRKLYGEISHEHRLELVNRVVDYCNNPTDAWPVITGNEICLLNVYDEEDNFKSTTWTATTNVDLTWLGIEGRGYEHTHKNPLRAAMIVFLQMQENTSD
ncbi:DUF2591 family protein [Salmonella enterica]|nr:DUF2591 family protein [Salmonella enterica]